MNAFPTFALIGAVLLIYLVGPAILAAALFALTDLCFVLWGKKRLSPEIACQNHAASIVIPSWNGRDLLEKFLPSVITAASACPGSEVLVVDNASTDGSVLFLRETFPQVRVLSLEKNHGFGGGSNLGFKAAKNDTVVLLNNDMRVEPDFLPPLLEPFKDPAVFSVSCQIFFSDPLRRREETGLTESWWERGRLRVSHRADSEIQVPYPCAYPGGGSSAFDRRKFLELGGFDELLRPFYYEDTDLGHMAWKRGWKLLYQPASVVFHEHRGTIGKRFSPRFIDRVLKKNVILYCWKNIHDWHMLLPQLLRCCTTPVASWRALRQVAEAIGARWRTHQLAQVSDQEAFRRQKGGYYRDRFQTIQETLPERMRVLFATPYAIEPPVHGGAVFMRQTLESLASTADVHLIGFVDTEDQRVAQQRLAKLCASTCFFLRSRRPPRNPSTTLPHAVREFWDPDMDWAIHKTLYLKQIDIVQLDYTILGQYGRSFHNIPCFLFEHDIFFQSLWRAMKADRFTWIGLLEYMRMLRYESGMLKNFSRVQVCSRENADYLLEFTPELRGRLDADTRTAIDTRRYPFVTANREADTVLFIGSFRHIPNVEAIKWFIERVFPTLIQLRPELTLIIVGADVPDSLEYWGTHPNIHIAGFVQDVRDPLTKCKVFIAPVLSGSGVRVKLLEAFACGIPVVSTTLGAEGLATRDMRICEIADDPDEFARSVARLLQDDEYAQSMAKKARKMVEEKDSRAVTAQLVHSYRAELEQLRNEPARLQLQ